MSIVQYLKKEQAVRIQAEAKDWKEAIQMGVEFLVRSGKANWEYYEGILKSVEKNGPYFVLMPGVVLPHARPEAGAIDTGYSLVILKSPVNFNSPENDPISVILTFCAKNAETQVGESLAQIAELFEDEAIVTQLINAKNTDEVYKILESANTSN